MWKIGPFFRYHDWFNNGEMSKEAQTFVTEQFDLVGNQDQYAPSILAFSKDDSRILILAEDTKEVELDWLPSAPPTVLRMISNWTPESSAERRGMMSQ
jgi:hypothetical protein